MRISRKELSTAFEWCEENEGTILAEKYMNICGAIGCGSSWKIYYDLKKYEDDLSAKDRRSNKWAERIILLDNDIYATRDKLAKIICDGVNRGHLDTKQ